MNIIEHDNPQARTRPLVEIEMTPKEAAALASYHSLPVDTGEEWRHGQRLFRRIHAATHKWNVEPEVKITVIASAEDSHNWAKENHSALPFSIPVLAELYRFCKGDPDVASLIARTAAQCGLNPVALAVQIKKIGGFVGE